MTTGGRRTFFKNFSSLALIAWEGRFVEYLEEKAHRLTDLINDEGVCRTAPATPGQLNILADTTLTTVHIVSTVTNVTSVNTAYTVLNVTNITTITIVTVNCEQLPMK